MIWYKSKTNWTLIIGAVGAIGAMLTGEVEMVTGIQTLVGCIAGIFLRQGVAKSGP